MRLPLRLHKLVYYEYWPWWMLYLPLLPLLLGYVIRSRSFYFYRRANPGLYNGGFSGERKQDLLQHIPPVYAPSTLVVPPRTPFATVEAWAQRTGFPLVGKPDVGERGNGVAKLDDMAQCAAYHQAQTDTYLLQAYVAYPTELGVFYSRLPTEATGRISSVTGKAYMTVAGDGRQAVAALMAQEPRYAMQLRRMQRLQPHTLQQVLPEGQTLLLEPIGNHCRGTRFTNRQDLCAHPQLLAATDAIAKSIPGFYYGRLDVKVTGLAGETPFALKVLEVNGVSSEPGHIYAQGYGLWRAYKDIFWHVRRMWRIARTVSHTSIKPT
jgi:hypothetical protein